MRIPFVLVLVLGSCAAPPRPPEAVRLALGRAIIDAALAGDDAKALSLIRQGADVDARAGERRDIQMMGDENWTPLHAACHKGRRAIVDALLDAGADPSLHDGHGATPLDFALESGPESLALRLIAAGAPVATRVGVYIDDYGSAGATALHGAAYRGFQDAARALLVRGANVHAKTSYGRTPLFGAADLAMIRLLREFGADLDALDRRGETPLAMSISHDHPERALLFIQAGADVNARCRDGTVLTEAVDRWWPRVVDALLARGADPDGVKDDGESALQIASHLALPEGEEMGLSLLRRGARAEVGKEPDDNIVHRAVMGNHRRLLKALIDKGASVKVGGRSGLTPLHQACAYPGDPEIVRLLLDAGADPTARDEDGKLPGDHLDDQTRPLIAPLLRKKP